MEKKTSSIGGEIMLAKSGFDVGSFKKLVQNLRVYDSNIVMQTISSGDVDGTVGQSHQHTVVGSIEERRQKTRNSVYQILSTRLPGDDLDEEDLVKLDTITKMGAEEILPLQEYQPGTKGRTSLDSTRQEYATFVQYFIQKRRKGESNYFEELKSTYQRLNHRREEHDDLSPIISVCGMFEARGASVPSSLRYLEQEYVEFVRAKTGKTGDLKDILQTYAKELAPHTPKSCLQYLLVRCGLETSGEENSEQPNAYSEALSLLKKPSNRLPTLMRGSEDYLWYKLKIMNNQTLELKNLQDSLANSADRFKDKEILYCKMLMLVHLFPLALNRIKVKSSIESVHIALGFAQWSYDSKVAEQKNLSQVSIKIVENYVKMFAHTDLRDAVAYYSLIGSDPNSTDVSEKIKLLVDLCMDSREIANLLGTMDKDGLLTSEGFLQDDHEKLQLLQMCRERCENTGRYDVSVILNFCLLRNDPSNLRLYIGRILKIMNQELSQVLLEDKKLEEFTDNVLKRLSRFSSELSTEPIAKTYETIRTLRNIIKVFQIYRSKNFPECLEQLKSLHLLPFSMNEMDSRLAEFKKLDKVITSKFSDILIMAFHLVKSSEKQLECLLTFAGFIPLSSEAYSKMLKIKSQL